MFATLLPKHLRSLALSGYLTALATGCAGSLIAPAVQSTPTVASLLPDVPAGSTVLTIASGAEARYRVTEQLVGRSFPNDAVGATQKVSGAIILGPDGVISPDASRIVVNVYDLTSDEGRRDNYLRNSSLQSARYPEVVFLPRAITGLSWPLPASGEASFQLVGDMTIRGMTKPATWDVTLTFRGEETAGLATTSFQFGYFNMAVPRVVVVLSVEDNIRLELEFRLTRSAA